MRHPEKQSQILWGLMLIGLSIALTAMAFCGWLLTITETRRR